MHYMTRYPHIVLLILITNMMHVYPCLPYTPNTEDTQDNAIAEDTHELYTLYDILQAYHEQPHSDVIPPHSKEELEYAEVLNNIDYTITESGKWGVEHVIQPRRDITAIRTIQNSINALITNPEARFTIQQSLRDIKESEAYLTSYFQPESEQSEPLGRDLYYNTCASYVPSCNISPKALSLGVYGGPSFTAAGSVMMLLLPSWFSQAHSYCKRLIQAWYSDAFSWSMMLPSSDECGEAIRNGTSVYVQSRSPFLSNLSDAGRYDRVSHIIYDQEEEHPIPEAMMLYYGADLHQPTTPSAGDTYYMFSMLSGFTSLGSCMFLSHYWWDVYNGLSLYNAYTKLSQRTSTVHRIHNIVYHIARIVRRTKTIDNIIQSCLPQEMYRELPHPAFLIGSHDDEHVQQLDTLLSSRTFAEQHNKRNRAPHLRKPRNRYSTGKTLAAHQLLTDHADSLLPLMQYVGIIDALSGIADMYDEHQGMDNSYCFATFDADRTTPHVTLERFWTPLMSAQNAVNSDISLDTMNAIFTGPNGIGKSTAMKGIAHCVILAQSIGIVPAARAHMSLFHHINTYLNIREDIQEGLSSFMAEKKRIDELYQESPHIHGNTLYLIDEPFRGTFADEAERRVYEFGAFINEHPHILMLLATHFAKPTMLDHEHRYINYHIGISEQLDGSFDLTYRVYPGILSWWFNNPEKRSRFIDWISDHMAANL